MIVGNWKMNTVPAKAAELSEALCADLSITSAMQSGVDVVICPPFTSLHTVHEVLQTRASSIALGAQDCGIEDAGAHTGDVSVPMLASVGCTYVIVGHSERRRDHFESDAVIGLKALRANAHGLTPIICIGETLEERQSGRTEDVLRHQLDGIAATAGVTVLSKSVLAYEPVWAIGTGMAASTDQVRETHAAIHIYLFDTFGLVLRVLYGGSLTASNAHELLRVPNVGGALVGGASLKPDQFAGIVEAAGRR